MDRQLADHLEKQADLSKTPFIQNAITERILEKTGGEGLYAKITIDLSVAHTDEKYDFYGDRMTVESIDDAVTIKLNSRKNDPIDLQEIPEIHAPIKCFFVTNDAGSGELNLLCGAKGMFEAKKKHNFLAAPDYIFYKDGSHFAALNVSKGIIYRNTDYATLAQKVIDELPTAGSGEIGDSTGAWIHNKFGYAEVSQKINLDECCRFTGNVRGYGTTLRLADNVDDTLMDICVPTNYHATIEHICFEGNKANNNMGVKALVNLDGYPIMRDCYIMRAQNKGMRITGQDVHLYNVYAEFCDDNGINTTNCQNLTLVNCTAWSNGGYGILSSGIRGSFYGCRIMNNVKDGLYLEGTTNLTISNSHIELNGECGIYMNGADYVKIIGNSFIDNSQNGDNTFSAIELVACEYDIIQGNTITGTGVLNDHKYGIEETGGSNVGNDIRGNICIGAQTGEYLTEATSGSPVNGTGTETANAEEPQLAWPIGTIVKFTDSGDASGDGTYIKDTGGNWVQLA